MVMNGMTNVGFAGGRLLYMRDHIFMARSFDLATGALHGDTERLAEDVLVDATIWKAAFDATSDLLAYTSGGRLTWQAEWYDRSGKPLNVPGEKTPDALAVRLSPDEDRLSRWWIVRRCLDTRPQAESDYSAHLWAWTQLFADMVARRTVDRV